jgi:vacuolar-type H+-ATPase subunit I/STV1
MEEMNTTSGEVTAPDAVDTTEKAPKFEGDFDAERASRLVANLRAEVDALKSDRDSLKSTLTEKEEAEKSEFEKAVSRAERAEQELAEARSRLLVAEIAKEYGVPAELLNGSTKEEVEARAKALSEWAGAAKRPAEEIPGKPKARLVPGNAPGDSDAIDPVALAAEIRSRN